MQYVVIVTHPLTNKSKGITYRDAKILRCSRRVPKNLVNGYKIDWHSILSFIGSDAVLIFMDYLDQRRWVIKQLLVNSCEVHRRRLDIGKDAVNR